jgi:predicted Zn-dependent protease
MDHRTNEALKAAPDVVVLQIETAALEHYRGERLDRAAEYLEQIVQMRPENGDYWCLLGVVYRRLGRRIEALKALSQAVESDKTDKNALVNLAEALVECGKVEEGVEILIGLFKAGYVEGVPIEEQDYFTQRAGAQLAIIKEVLDGTRQMLSPTDPSV